LLKEYAIEVVPLIVHFETDTYHDGALSVERFREKAAGAFQVADSIETRIKAKTPGDDRRGF
jgi:hypothetical protein